MDTPIVSSAVRMKDLKDVLSVFKQYGVRAFVSYGVVLGAVRDKDFIKWDDDIDISIVDPIDYKTRKAIGWKLFDLGFTPQGISFNVFGRLEPSEIGYNGDDKSGIIVCERGFKFSIFFFEEVDCPLHGKEMVCTPKLSSVKLLCSPAKFYEKGEQLKLLGEKFLVPSPLKEYLEYTYGNWKKPVPGYHAPQYRELHPDYKPFD